MRPGESRKHSIQSSETVTRDTDAYPSRIVCLTEETTETLYLLGQGHRVVGVSGYTVRPSEARQKPRISAFVSANLEKIVSLRPDLVVGFSDLQADIASALIKRGLNVMIFNQRSVADILQMIRVLGGLVGCHSGAESLASKLATELEAIRESANRFPRRLRTFFEEWDDPLISGIRWVEELVEIAGGQPIFPELAESALARDRIVDPSEVARRNPEIVFASWCGKRVRKHTIRSRTGWENVAAIVSDRIFEIKSTYILQPGPASLTEGVRQLHEIFRKETAAGSFEE
jgi:iron complex transport system substrate-binding protein